MPGAVVLAPSLGASPEMWDPQVPALSEAFEVVRYQHRVPPRTLDDLGREVLALLDERGLERVSFCGISLGGIVGMWLALHAPERLDRLVLACTAPHLPPPERWSERASAVRAAGSAAGIAGAVVARWLTPEHASRHPEKVAWLERMVATTPPDLYAGCCDALQHLDLRGAVGAIDVPTLVISADRDEATPAAAGEALASAIPGARFELIEGAAHLANLEQPDAFNRLLLAHLRPPLAR